MDRPPRASAPWSKQDDALLRLGWESGKDVDRLAQMLDRSGPAIRQRLHQLGLAPYEPLESVRQRTPRHGEPWTDEERAAIVAMARQGMPLLEIAQRQGRSETSIRFQLQRAGWSVGP